MSSKIFKIIAAGVILTGVTATSVHAASPYGNWKRPNGSIAKVWKCGAKMCAKVIKGKGAGFTMFRGLKKTGGSTWKGNMKHPKMGNLFNFNGSVRLSGRSLSVKGCMIGGSFCDAETWRKR